MVFLIPLLCDLILMWIAIGIRRQIHQPQLYKAILMDVPPHVKHIALLFAEILFVMTSQPAHSWEVLFPWLGLFMRYVYNSNLEKKTYGYCISLR